MTFQVSTSVAYYSGRDSTKLSSRPLFKKAIPPIMAGRVMGAQTGTGKPPPSRFPILQRLEREPRRPAL